nr:hypothetical protein [Pandoravirus belohorizontensis]
MRLACTRGGRAAAPSLPTWKDLRNTTAGRRTAAGGDAHDDDEDDEDDDEAGEAREEDDGTDSEPKVKGPLRRASRCAVRLCAIFAVVGVATCGTHRSVPLARLFRGFLFLVFLFFLPPAPYRLFLVPLWMRRSLAGLLLFFPQCLASATVQPTKKGPAGERRPQEKGRALARHLFFPKTFVFGSSFCCRVVANRAGLLFF